MSRPLRPSAAERLNASLAQRREAEAAREAALDRGDAKAVGEADTILAGLRPIIERQQHEATDEAQAGACAAATAVRAALVAEYVAALATLEPAAAKARAAIRAACVVARKAYAKWNAAARVRHEVALLDLRFALANGAPLAALPDAPNIAVTVFEQEGAEVIRRPQLPTIVRTAEMSAAQVRRATLEALAKYLKRHRAGLSPEVLALFDRAPIPDLTVTETEGERERRETREANLVHEQMRMGQAVADVKEGYDRLNVLTAETEPQKKERLAARRRVTRDQAAAIRALGEEAALIEQSERLKGRTRMRG